MLVKKFNIFITVYLDDILIYIEDPDQSYIVAIRQIHDVLKKHGFFANLNKCHFYINEICFFGYVILTQEIKIKEKRIKVIKNWLKPKSIKDIQIFLGFANFYYCFIQYFSRIAILLTSMLKILTLLSGSQSSKIADGVNDEVVEGRNGSGNTAFASKS